MDKYLFRRSDYKMPKITHKLANNSEVKVGQDAGNDFADKFVQKISQKSETYNMQYTSINIVTALAITPTRASLSRDPETTLLSGALLAFFNIMQCIR